MQRLPSAITSTEERFGGKTSCQNACINISHFPVLKDCLPDHEYHVCDYETLSKAVDHVNFRATLRMALSSEAEIKEWLKSHTVTWRVERTHKTTQQKVLFNVNYRCQHYQPKRGKETVPNNLVPVKSKNTNCPAKMTIKLARTEVSRGRQSLSSDPHLPAFPTTVRICSDHNHNIYVAEALGYGDVGCGAREKRIHYHDQFFQPQREEAVLETETDADLHVAIEGGREDTAEEGMVTADVAEEAASEDASHQAAAGITEMFEDMLAKVGSDSSLAVAVVAALKVYKKIQNNPAKLSTAWHMFGRDNNTRLASVRSTANRRAARHAGPAIHAQPTALSRRKVHSGGKTTP